MGREIISIQAGQAGNQSTLPFYYRTRVTYACRSGIKIMSSWKNGWRL